MKNKKQKVICAMSGGVDSSTAAALLKKQGFDVVGIFLVFMRRNGLPVPGSQESAKKVAKKLGITLKVLDISREFKRYVIDYFIKEYSRCYTPDPCVACNKKIKFGFLLKKALSLGADYVATGHYARLRREIPNSKFQIPKFRLLRAKDKTKDQSYFLWTLTQRQLKYLLFPIGDYTKKQVRNLARKFGLPTAYRRESQGICFILEKDYNAFLKRYLKNIKLGPIKTIDEEVIGQHKGLPFYTIGQRKGIGIGGGKPYYVAELDFKHNALIVSRNERDLYAQGLKVRDVNWISGVEPRFPLKISAVIRYRHKPVSAQLMRTKADKHGSCYQVLFKKAQRAVTPGQSVVFYKRNEVLGGGIIEKSKIKNQKFSGAKCSVVDKAFYFCIIES